MEADKILYIKAVKKALDITMDGYAARCGVSRATMHRIYTGAEISERSELMVWITTIEKLAPKAGLPPFEEWEVPETVE